MKSTFIITRTYSYVPANLVYFRYTLKDALNLRQELELLHKEEWLVAEVVKEKGMLATLVSAVWRVLHGY